ncbi:hypothetical protein ILYODFUR_006754 [Ilyodon furcidens]|uniref:Uncharacterized protein n=1 Tax=Ilyodon furcidens TaxID=33524 RepID=A0ABV0U3Y4_9TELE
MAGYLKTSQITGQLLSLRDGVKDTWPVVTLIIHSGLTAEHLQASIMVSGVPATNGDGDSVTNNDIYCSPGQSGMLEETMEQMNVLI